MTHLLRNTHRNEEVYLKSSISILIIFILYNPFIEAMTVAFDCNSPPLSKIREVERRLDSYRLQVTKLKKVKNILIRKEQERLETLQDLNTLSRQMITIEMSINKLLASSDELNFILREVKSSLQNDLTTNLQDLTNQIENISLEGMDKNSIQDFENFIVLLGNISANEQLNEEYKNIILNLISNSLTKGRTDELSFLVSLFTTIRVSLRSIILNVRSSKPRYPKNVVELNSHISKLDILPYKQFLIENNINTAYYFSEHKVKDLLPYYQVEVLLNEVELENTEYKLKSHERLLKNMCARTPPRRLKKRIYNSYLERQFELRGSSYSFNESFSKSETVYCSRHAVTCAFYNSSHFSALDLISTNEKLENARCSPIEKKENGFYTSCNSGAETAPISEEYDGGLIVQLDDIFSKELSSNFVIELPGQSASSKVGEFECHKVVKEVKEVKYCIGVRSGGSILANTSTVDLLALARIDTTQNKESWLVFGKKADLWKIDPINKNAPIVRWKDPSWGSPPLHVINSYFNRGVE